MRAMTPSAETLMRQASHPAEYHFSRAYEFLGKDAKPELIAAFVNASAQDFLATFIRQGIDDLSDVLGQAFEKSSAK